MKRSDGLPEKARRWSKLVDKIGTKKLTNTKLQNVEYRISRNRQMERQTDRHKIAQAANGYKKQNKQTWPQCHYYSNHRPC